jgi:hypothetical protein
MKEFKHMQKEAKVAVSTLVESLNFIKDFQAKNMGLDNVHVTGDMVLATEFFFERSNIEEWQEALIILNDYLPCANRYILEKWMKLQVKALNRWGFNSFPRTELQQSYAESPQHFLTTMITMATLAGRLGNEFNTSKWLSELFFFNFIQWSDINAWLDSHKNFPKYQTVKEHWKYSQGT